MSSEGIQWSRVISISFTQVQFADHLHEQFGAPAVAYLIYETQQKGVLRVSVIIVNKTSTRYPEATYFGFDPVGNDVVNGSQLWVLDKIGYPVDVVDVAAGGGRGLQSILKTLNYTGNGGKQFLSFRLSDF